MSGCPGDATLALLVEGGLAPAPRGSVVAHLDRCPSCRALVAEVISTGARAPATAGPTSGSTVTAGTAPPATMASAAAQLPGSGSTVAGRYRLGEVLGQGGMGVVFEAFQRDLERTVAVKLLARSADPTRAVRFAREARTLAQLAHPNIVQIFDYGVEAGVAYVVMERLQGQTLAEALLAESRLDVTTTVRIALDVLAALGVAHAASVVHRDVKPANIFLVSDAPGVPSRVKLLDFGIAATNDGSLNLTETGETVGTPAYMAPEQILARTVDSRTDLHAVGVCIFEMLTGGRPYVAPSCTAIIAEIVLGNARRVDAVQPDVPPQLADVVARAMAGEPGARFESAEAMAAALAPFKKQGEGAPRISAPPRMMPAPRPALGPPALAPTPSRDGRSWIPFLVGALAMLVVGLVAALVIFARMPPARTDKPPPPAAVPPASSAVAADAVREAPTASAASSAAPPTPAPAADRRVLSICVASDGSFVCPAKLASGCDTQDARLNPTLAVPGTPCSGTPERGSTATTGIFRAKK